MFESLKKKYSLKSITNQQNFTAAPTKGHQPTLLMHIPVSRRREGSGEVVFTVEFSTLIQTEQQEGLYELYFHNCRFQGGSTKKALQVTGEVILYFFLVTFLVLLHLLHFTYQRGFFFGCSELLLLFKS